MRKSYSSQSRDVDAEALVADIFESHGWDVNRSPRFGKTRPDLMVRKGGQYFVVEVKTLAEGRADRVIPLLSQAFLQASAYALDTDNAQPLAIICVGDASQSLSEQLESFVKKYIPNVAIGLVSKSGLRYFKGAGLEELNAEPEEARWHGRSSSNQSINLFSDLNQWMLKVLLAPEIPDHLLQAPRRKYQSGSELAEAAEVSAMSASRFLSLIHI